MLWLIAFVMIGAIAVCYGGAEWAHRHFTEHHGTPPPDPNEDDPDFHAWVYRKAHYYKDDV